MSACWIASLMISSRMRSNVVICETERFPASLNTSSRKMYTAVARSTEFMVATSCSRVRQLRHAKGRAVDEAYHSGDPASLLRLEVVFDARRIAARHAEDVQIGRASCRERV